MLLLPAQASLGWLVVRTDLLVVIFLIISCAGLDILAVFSVNILDIHSDLQLNIIAVVLAVAYAIILSLNVFFAVLLVSMNGVAFFIAVIHLVFLILFSF